MDISSRVKRGISQQKYDEALEQLATVRGSMRALTKQRTVMQMPLDLDDLKVQERKYLRIIAQGPTAEHKGQSLENRESRQFLRGEYSTAKENYARIKARLDEEEKSQTAVKTPITDELRTQAETILRAIDIPHTEGKVLPTIEEVKTIIAGKEKALMTAINESNKALKALRKDGLTQEMAESFKTAVDEYLSACQQVRESENNWANGIAQDPIDLNAKKRTLNEKRKILQESIRIAYQKIDLAGILRGINDFDGIKLELIDLIFQTEDPIKKKNLEQMLQLMQDNVDRLKKLYDIAIRCGAYVEESPGSSSLNNLSQLTNERIDFINRALEKHLNTPLGIMLEGAVNLIEGIKSEKQLSNADEKIEETGVALVFASYTANLIGDIFPLIHAVIDLVQSNEEISSVIDVYDSDSSVSKDTDQIIGLLTIG